MTYAIMHLWQRSELLSNTRKHGGRAKSMTLFDQLSNSMDDAHVPCADPSRRPGSCLLTSSASIGSLCERDRKQMHTCCDRNAAAEPATQSFVVVTPPAWCLVVALYVRAPPPLRRPLCVVFSLLDRVARGHRAAFDQWMKYCQCPASSYATAASASGRCGGCRTMR
jgi:hypothetical protein